MPIDETKGLTETGLFAQVAGTKKTLKFNNDTVEYSKADPEQKAVMDEVIARLQ